MLNIHFSFTTHINDDNDDTTTAHKPILSLTEHIIPLPSIPHNVVPLSLIERRTTFMDHASSSSFTSSSSTNLHCLPSDLLAITCSFLSLKERFLSLTHICHDLHDQLIPSCFRGHLVIDDAAISALPTLTAATLAFLTSATSLSVEFKIGRSDMETSFRSFLSHDSSRSLLHFSSITSLTLRFGMTTSKFRSQLSPLSHFSFLLTSANRAVLPKLTTLHLHGRARQCVTSSSFPFHHLPSLSSLTLCDITFADVARVCGLLSLPAMRRLNLRGCRWNRAYPKQDEEQCKRKSEEMAKERGIELLWFDDGWHARCGANI